MSRPHDGQRTSLPFGNPFRRIFPKGSYLSPKLLSLLNSFEQNLAESLKNLKPKDGSDVLSLSWMRQAMASLSETHNSIKTLMTDLQFPVSDWDEKWMDMYLDNSVKLLDICIALSSEISRLDQRCLLLQFILHTFDSARSFPSAEQVKRADASLNDWMQQINSRSPKLENCFLIVQGLVGTFYPTKAKNSPKGKVLIRALYGIKMMTILVCSIFTAAFSGCSKPLMDLHVPEKFAWASAFNDLQSFVNVEVRNQFSNGKTTVLKELEAVQVCVERLRVLTATVGQENEEQINGSCDEEDEAAAVGKFAGQEERERLHNSVSELAESVERLSDGLDLLSKQVGGFFQIVLTGRDALLCNLRVFGVEQESTMVANRS